MRQGAHFQMPFLLSGQIISVSNNAETGELAPIKNVSSTTEESEGKDMAVGYTVLVDFPNGSSIPFTNVVQACLFGGIGDFFQSRLRASNDPSGKFEYAKEMSDSEKLQTSIGSRVLVAFIGGDTRKPCIVGALPHTSRVLDLPDATKNNTQAKLSYKGIEWQVNDVGEMKILTRGAPSEKSSEQQTEPYERVDGEPVPLPERENASPLPSPALPQNKPPKLMEGPSIAEPTANDSLEYPDKKYTTEMGFLELGEWYVVDTEGQVILLDRDSKTLTLSNGFESIQIDKANKKIFIESSGDMETICKNDSYTSIHNDKHTTVDKNEWYAVKSDEYRSVGNTRTANIVDKDVIKVGSSWSLNIGTADKVAGGTGTSANKHKAEIKISTGNSLTIDDDQILLVHKSGAMLNADKAGNMALFAKDGTSIYLNATKGAVSFMSKKGGVFSLDDKITIMDKTGKQMIAVKDSSIDITSGTDVNITAMNVNINSGTCNVGDKATMSAVLGENLQLWLDMHIHATGVGPSGPPIVPTSTFTKTPLDILSSAVKIRKGGP